MVADRSASLLGWLPVFEFALDCLMSYALDKGQSLVKGKRLLPVAMSNAQQRRFGGSSLKRDIIESASVERIPPTIDPART
jgi:hypothetical protein